LKIEAANGEENGEEQTSSASDIGGKTKKKETVTVAKQCH
jgi:hypothetical protein